MMHTRVADAAAKEETIVTAGSLDDLQGAVPLELSHRIGSAGEAVVDISGELDIATAGLAVRYVRQVIDRHRGPLTVDLGALGFCDAGGPRRLSAHGWLRGAGGLRVPAGLAPAAAGQDHADHRPGPQAPRTRQRD